MENIKGIIFDLDGVLVFTDHYHYLAWKEMADSINCYFDEIINNKLRGVSRMASLDIILKNYKGIPFTKEQKEELAFKKNEIYKKLLNKMSPADVTKDVRDTLIELRKRGYKLSLGSSSKNAKFILKQVDLIDYFDAISDGTNITNSKPDPEVFLKGASFLGLNPENCAVVEDAYAGIDAAKAGNMVAVAIGDATTYEKADIKLAKFSDLLLYFKQIQK